MAMQFYFDLGGDDYVWISEIKKRKRTEETGRSREIFFANWQVLETLFKASAGAIMLTTFFRRSEGNVS